MRTPCPHAGKPFGRTGIKLWKTACLSVLLAASAGCHTLERSRDLGDANVPAQTLAVQVCANCHGVDGNSVSPNFPRLAAQQEAYFVAQMNGFRSHNRADPAGFEYMWGLSKRLSDEQINGLASYFASQKPKVGPGSDAKTIASGQAIFEHGVPEKNLPACASCHGAHGEGNGRFPRLANQHADYLVKQLMVFQRTNDRPEGSIMKTVAHELTRDNMEALAAYLQALPVSN